MNPIDLYYELQADNELSERLDLSCTDFGWLAVAFVANGGGSRAEFWSWLNELSFEEAQRLVRS